MSDLPDKLRQTWPLGSFGPLTTAQRELAHEAADYITTLEAKLVVAREALGWADEYFDHIDPGCVTHAKVQAALKESKQ